MKLERFVKAEKGEFNIYISDSSLVKDCVKLIYKKN